MGLSENEDDSQDEESEDDDNDLDDDEEEESEEESEEDVKKGNKKVLGETKPLTDEAIAEYNAKLKQTGVVCNFSIFQQLGLFEFYSTLHDLYSNHAVVR